jgi:iron-sulfur cluster protein
MSGRSPFAERYDKALADPNVSDGLLEFQRAWKVSRGTQIAELEAFSGQDFAEHVDVFRELKRESRSRWTELAAEFTDNVEAAGGHVHTTSTIADACRAVGEILTDAGAGRVVKTKSMVSEEIFLNDHLVQRGIEVVETDLGEWLIQLDRDHPSHLVLPVIHKRRHQVAKILEAELGVAFDPDDIEAMVRAARKALRQRFLGADAGLTGANALIASTGGVLLVTNEGNATLTTQMPDVHIVIAGLDKLVPDTSAIMSQVRLLGRSATGQRMTSFTTVVNGPRPGQEWHVVLVDNGRSAMAADAVFSDALACIRCGACADVCPPYQVVGGHVFGHVYTGAIGLVNTSFHHGLDAVADPQLLCLSCNACVTACPTGIPLASQILEVRKRVFEERQPPVKKLALRAFRSRRLTALGATVAGLVTAPLRTDDGLRLPLPKRHGWRKAPNIPIVPGRRKAARIAEDDPPADEYPSSVSGKDVALFLQCLSDRAAPAIVEATAKLIRRAGANVVIPERQHCCGLTAFDAGDWSGAIEMLTDTLDALEGCDVVVTPGTSCLVATHEYEALVRDTPDLAARLDDLRSRFFDVVGFLTGPGSPPAGRTLTSVPGTVTVHRFCQSTNVLQRGGSIEELLDAHVDATRVELAEAEVCCGFGGSTSIVAPEVSRGIAVRKLDNVADTGAEIIVTDNPGCILHLRAALAARGDDVRVLHLAELLAM